MIWPFCRDCVVSELFWNPIDVLFTVYSDTTGTKGNLSLLVVIQVTASPWMGFLFNKGSVIFNSADTTFHWFGLMVAPCASPNGIAFIFNNTCHLSYSCIACIWSSDILLNHSPCPAVESHTMQQSCKSIPCISNGRSIQKYAGIVPLPVIIGCMFALTFGNLCNILCLS